MRRFRILRIRDGERQQVDDPVSREIALKLIPGYDPFVTLVCSPSHLQDLIYGFLFTLGMIERVDDVRRIVINRATWSAFIELSEEFPAEPQGFVLNPGCGFALSPAPRGQAELPPVDADLFIKGGQILSLMRELSRSSLIHQETGGEHSAALTDTRNVLVFREDIGRHNAVDKVIGRALTQGLSFAECILLTSGRVSSEVVMKAWRCGAPVIASRSAPTDRSIQIAREAGITLIGFARGRRLNVYSGEQRIDG
jgi:FdhD protein